MSIEIAGSSITLELVCTECNHAWTVTENETSDVVTVLKNAEDSGCPECGLS